MICNFPAKCPTDREIGKLVTFYKTLKIPRFPKLMENIKVPQTTLVYPLSGSIVIRNIKNREVFLFCKSGKHVQNLNTPLKREPVAGDMGP